MLAAWPVNRLAVRSRLKSGDPGGDGGGLSLNEPGDDVQNDAVLKKQECLGFVLDEAESGAFVAFEDGDFLARECGGQGCNHSSKVNNPGGMDQRSNTLIRGAFVFWGGAISKIAFAPSRSQSTGIVRAAIPSAGAK